MDQPDDRGIDREPDRRRNEQNFQMRRHDAASVKLLLPAPGLRPRASYVITLKTALEQVQKRTGRPEEVRTDRFSELSGAPIWDGADG